jgi:NADH-quinone oxidoreductase subunit G
LELEGFDYESSEAVRTEAFSKFELPSALNNQLKAGAVTPNTAVAQNGLQRIGEVPIYQMDAVVRRASSLQKTHDAAAPVAWMHSALLEKLGLKEGAMVNLRQGDAAVALPATRDDRLPQDCVRVAAAHPLTAGLGGMLDAIIVERAS